MGGFSSSKRYESSRGVRDSPGRRSRWRAPSLAKRRSVPIGEAYSMKCQIGGRRGVGGSAVARIFPKFPKNSRCGVLFLVVEDAIIWM